MIVPGWDHPGAHVSAQPQLPPLPDNPENLEKTSFFIWLRRINSGSELPEVSNQYRNAESAGIDPGDGASQGSFQAAQISQTGIRNGCSQTTGMNHTAQIDQQNGASPEENGGPSLSPLTGIDSQARIGYLETRKWTTE